MDTDIRYKFPRIPHLPWSESVSADDIIAPPSFEGQEVVVTRKMDGEGFTGYQGGSHARSPDSRNHPSRDWARRYWMERSWKLPAGWRISGENLYAKHSLGYTNLPSYLLGFGAWDDTLTYLSWDDTTALFQSLDIPMVDVLYRGTWNEKAIKALWNPKDRDTHEGYVVRLTKAFAYDGFSENIRKFVRSGHMQTDQHWMYAPIVPNGLQS